MTHIKQRGRTAAEWTASNEVLYENEVGWETNTRRSKLGDGVTPWNDLSYTVSTLSVTKADVGLDQADNTSDEDKPLSSAAVNALLAKAPKDSPVFTGNPTAPTPATTDNDTTLATTAFVQAAIAAALASPDFAESAIAASISDAIGSARLVSNPVGSIRLTTDNVNPSNYLGGTWVAWGAGRLPVGVDTTQTEFNAVEKTGGAKTVTLTAVNLPPHTHGANAAGRQFMVNDPAAAANRANGSDVNMIGANTTGNGPGTSAPVNNLAPYITCYMWKRTA